MKYTPQENVYYIFSFKHYFYNKNRAVNQQTNYIVQQLVYIRPRQTFKINLQYLKNVSTQNHKTDFNLTLGHYK